LNLVQEEEEIDEEEENDKMEIPEKTLTVKNTNKVVEPQIERREVDYRPVKVPTRYRSRSENLNNGSIFKFMENTLGGRKAQEGTNYLF